MAVEFWTSEEKVDSDSRRDIADMCVGVVAASEIRSG